MTGITNTRSVIRRHIPFLYALCTLGAALLMQPFSATGQVKKVSLQELSRSSTSVVLGKTTRTESRWNEERTRIFTEVTIQVQERIKGEAESETIITIPGGRVGDTLYEVSDMPVFVLNEETLVFLWQHPSGKQLVNGGVQGKMVVILDARRDRKVVRGAAHLFEPESASKVGEETDVPLRQMALEDVIQSVKQTRNE